MPGTPDRELRRRASEVAPRITPVFLLRRNFSAAGQFRRLDGDRHQQPIDSCRDNQRITAMYQQLADFAKKPEPFSRYTVDALWTNPHIGRRMLAYHLNPDIDAASRRAETIEATVEWFDRRFGLRGKRVLDLGCGPGLYATRMAARGAGVTGLDFSPVSIAHAQEHAPKGADLQYIRGNYLEDPLPGESDLVVQIYGDYCALSPDRRSRLLSRVASSLRPGGTFVFDVYSPGQMRDLTEALEFGHRYMDGFWSADDYFGFKSTALYPEHMASLERYLIVEASRSFEIFNWMQYFTPDAIAAELQEAGFKALGVFEVGSGQPWAGGATPFFVVAQPERSGSP